MRSTEDNQDAVLTHGKSAEVRNGLTPVPDPEPRWPIDLGFQE